MKLFHLIKEMGDTETSCAQEPHRALHNIIDNEDEVHHWHVAVCACMHTHTCTLSTNSQFISEADLRHGWMSSYTSRSTIPCAVHILHAGQGTFMVSEWQSHPCVWGDCNSHTGLWLSSHFHCFRWCRFLEVQPVTSSAVRFHPPSAGLAVIHSWTWYYFFFLPWLKCISSCWFSEHQTNRLLVPSMVPYANVSPLWDVPPVHPREGRNPGALT